MKKSGCIFLVILLFISALMITCCDRSDASTAAHNLSKAADMFEINRRVIFYNGITDKYILVIEGRCSVEFSTDKFVVTVKTGKNSFKKHYLGKTDNVFPFVEQLDDAPTDVFHYKVILKPAAIIPNIDLKLKN